MELISTNNFNGENACLQKKERLPVRLITQHKQAEHKNNNYYKKNWQLATSVTLHTPRVVQ